MTFLLDLIRLARPKHWVKSGFVLAPLLFVRPEPLDVAISRAGLAVLVFCLLASAIYCVNDVIDAPADREHPTKRLRPVAAKRVSPAAAIAWGVVLAIA